MNNKLLETKLQEVLSGHTVQIGIYNIHEDYIYTRKKDENSNPILNRVLSMVYFDEAETNQPSTESFDGTMESFLNCMKAHNVLDYYKEN